MLNRKSRILAGILLMLSIVCADLCFFGQSVDTYSFYALKQDFFGGNGADSSQIFEGRQFIREERLVQNSGTTECLRRSGKERGVRFLGRVMDDLAACRYLPHIFGYTMRAVTGQKEAANDGHLSLIRCIYRKDGKKRSFI